MTGHGLPRMTGGRESLLSAHTYERAIMGYVGGDDDTPEWYAKCSCGWRGPLRDAIEAPWDDYTLHVAAKNREQQCAYRRVGATVHHRVPGCGMSWPKFDTAVVRGEIEVLLSEPTDSRRCPKCYSDASYERHPL